MDARRTDAAGQGASSSASLLARWEKRERLTVGLFLAVFLAVGLLAVNPYLTGSDQISYITIAQKYAHGQFGQAVNGYWAPLFPWLLAPLLALGIEAVAATKILTLLTAAWLLLNLHRLSQRFALTFPLRMMVLLAMGPVLLVGFVFIISGPDILAAALILGYLSVLLDARYLERPCSGVMCGLWAGLSFLAKSYALAFVGLHLFLIHVFFFMRTGQAGLRKRVLSRFLGALAVFLCVCGPWVAAVSLKYHRLMFSSSTRVSLYLVSPASKGSGDHPAKRGGLSAPPTPTAVSAWEDPTVYLKTYTRWSPFQSRSDLTYWLLKVAANFWNTFLIFLRFSFLSPAILLAGLILACYPRRNPSAFISLLTLALYTSGYLALYVLDRYLILDLALIILLAALLLGMLARRMPSAPRAASPILAGLVLLSFFLMPYRYLSLFSHGREKFEVSEGYTDVQLYRLSRPLLSRVPPRAKIASNACYGRTQFLAYYLGGQYYGIVTPQASPEAARAELARFGIDYLFFWSKVKPTDPWLASDREITHGKLAPLWVYRLKERGEAP